MYLTQFRHLYSSLIVPIVLLVFMFLSLPPSVLAQELAENQSLFHACKTGNANHIRSFLSTDNVNITDDYGRTPLHYVANYKADPEAIQLLVDKGADINAQTRSGMTPLLYCAKYNPKLESLKTLLENGANPNITMERGISALHYLGINNASAELVRLFLEYGAAPNVSSENGLAPLHLFTQNANLTAVRLLVESGANVNVKAENGWTPFNQAAKYAQSKIMLVYLVENGADTSEALEDLYYAKLNTSRAYRDIIMYVSSFAVLGDWKTTEGDTVTFAAINKDGSEGVPEPSNTAIDDSDEERSYREDETDEPQEPKTIELKPLPEQTINTKQKLNHPDGEFYVHWISPRTFIYTENEERVYYTGAQLAKVWFGTIAHDAEHIVLVKRDETSEWSIVSDEETEGETEEDESAADDDYRYDYESADDAYEDDSYDDYDEGYEDPDAEAIPEDSSETTSETADATDDEYEDPYDDAYTEEPEVTDGDEDVWDDES